MKGSIAALLAAALLSGCASGPSDSADKPAFGGSNASAPKASDLARAKAATGIEDCPATAPSKAIDKGLPALRLDCLGGGRPVHLASLAGKPSVINLWASWCGPCREELPLLAKAHRELGDKVQILGIDFADDAPDLALRLAADSGVTYPLIADPKSALRTNLRVIGLPQTVFVDAQGTIVATERRAFRSYADLTDAISQHLGLTP